jgi:energy-coupling factor transporter ATP-binding protein EcfA2
VTPIDLMDTLVIAIREGHQLLIVGPPGIGKSDIIDQAAWLTQSDLIISHPAVEEPVDYKGMPAIIKGEDGREHAVFFPFGQLEDMITATKRTVVFFDDLGQAPVAVQAAVMQLLLARQVNGKKISDQVVFMAATNDRKHKAGVHGLLEPVKGRFTSIVNLETNLESWQSWAVKAHLSPQLISFIAFKPSYLSAFKPTADMTNSPTPRNIASVNKIITAPYPPHVVSELITGAVGEAFTAEFNAFRKVYMKLPDPKKVIADPENHPIPDPHKDPSVLYALCGAIGALASKATFDNIITFINRLPDEYSAFAFLYSINHHPRASSDNPTSFTKWANAHPDIIF